MSTSATALYVGILDGKDDVWGVRVPDVPGCYGADHTPEAAMADAISAIREVLAEGFGSRFPRDVRAILADRSVKLKAAHGDTLVMLSVPLKKRKKAHEPA